MKPFKHLPIKKQISGILIRLQQFQYFLHNNYNSWFQNCMSFFNFLALNVFILDLNG